MTVRELIEFNHECDDLFIRESNGNMSRPLFNYTLTSGKIPNEILDREVKHFQAGLQHKYERTISCLHITLYM